MNELQQRVIEELLALAEYATIPSHAVTKNDLMKGTATKKGMSESSAYRLLRRLHTAGKYQRARGPQGAMYYWPVEGDKP